MKQRGATKATRGAIDSHQSSRGRQIKKLERQRKQSSMAGRSYK